MYDIGVRVWQLFCVKSDEPWKKMIILWKIYSETFLEYHVQIISDHVVLTLTKRHEMLMKGF